MTKIVKLGLCGVNLLFRKRINGAFLTASICRLYCISAGLCRMSVSNYLSRINHHGSLEPNVETLAKLTRLHKAVVPYTNVEFVNGTRKILELPVIYDRIVNQRSGGVCHEVSGLFAWLLRELGYDVALYPAKYYIDTTKEWSGWTGHSFPFVSFAKLVNRL